MGLFRQLALLCLFPLPAISEHSTAASKPISADRALGAKSTEMISLGKAVSKEYFGFALLPLVGF